MEVKNRIFGWAFDTLDLPIRFLYSKLNLNRLFFWKLYSSDFKGLDKRFIEMERLVSKEGFFFKGKVCLELGPGNSYVNAYNFLVRSAKEVILVDKFPRQIETKKQKELLQKEIEFFNKKHKAKKLNTKSIEFISKDITETGRLEVDFVYSISVFEHLKHVEKTIKKLGEIVKKNGLMYHSIDLRDHYNFRSPFLFYKYSDKTWKKYLTKEGVSYTNRMRYSEIKKLFLKYGFEIISEEKERSRLGNTKISCDFDIKDRNLNISIWRVLLKKL